MKIYTLSFLIAGFFISSAHAEQSFPDILSNKEVETCINLHGERSDECIGEISDSSEKKLELAYQKTLNSFQSFDYSLWWMGNKEQRDNLIENYKLSQKSWQQYKLSYCRTVSAALQNTHVIAESLTSCFINMNQRRIEDINSQMNYLDQR